MSKRVLFFLLTICFTFNINILSAFANVEAENDSLQNLNTQIEQLKIEIQTLRDEKTNEYLSLSLQREKDISSSLYDFTMLFVVLITLFVTIAGVIISFLLYKLNSHQKKIDLVLNSKEFDEKLIQIENRIDEIRLTERNNYKNKLIAKIQNNLKSIEGHISSIEDAKTTIHGEDAEIYKEKHDFKGLILEVEVMKDEFEKLESIILSKEDEYQKDSNLPEHQLASLSEKIIIINDKLRHLHWHEIYPV